MTRNGIRRLLALGAVLTMGAAGCGNISKNDFDQTLSFDGFFQDVSCGTGLAWAEVFTEPVVDSAGVATNCSEGAICFVNLKVTNHATGVPIPITGGQGATGNPVPVTQGLVILGQHLHLEYTLPLGQLPPRDYDIADRLTPGGDVCRSFQLLEPRDTVAMVQDPLSFPQTPFYMTARVTYEAVTGGGQDIRTHGDIDIQVF